MSKPKEDRLSNLKQMRADELATISPSRLYLSDLDETIKWLEGKVGTPNYEMSPR